MIGLYAHVPYCTVRCSYCDFYLVPARGRDTPGYAAALAAEIEAAGRERPGLAADTFHCGGGTPSVLAPDDLVRLLDAARAAFRLDRAAEVTLEANPEDVDGRRAEAWRAAGFDRIAIGVQSFDDARLRLMRRPHDARRAAEALATARAAGFRSVAVDLILGFPGPGPDPILVDAARAADLGADHLSVYLLEVHERTRLGRAVSLGRTAPAPADAAADLYEAVSDLLERRGFEHYEISNFARPSHRSRHNTKYWSDGEYLGFGPSAHSYVGGERWANQADLGAYLRSGGAGVRRIPDQEPRSARALEALVTGLRLAEGVDLGRLRQRYGAGLPRPEGECIRDLVAAGLASLVGERFALTRRGRLVSNEVFERLMRDIDRSGGTVS